MKLAKNYQRVGRQFRAGCQAARHTLKITPPPPLNWLDELNLDPRHRAVAALGTQVVQTEQEQLVASAWEQLGEIERINQMRRQARPAAPSNGYYTLKNSPKSFKKPLLKLLLQ